MKSYMLSIIAILSVSGSIAFSADSHSDGDLPDNEVLVQSQDFTAESGNRYHFAELPYVAFQYASCFATFPTNADQTIEALGIGDSPRAPLVNLALLDYTVDPHHPRIFDAVSTRTSLATHSEVTLHANNFEHRANGADGISYQVVTRYTGSMELVINTAPQVREDLHFGYGGHHRFGVREFSGILTAKVAHGNQGLNIDHIAVVCTVGSRGVRL